MAKSDANIQNDKGYIEVQVQQQASKQQVRMQIDQHNMHSSYVNVFCTHATVEEFAVDFGLNQIVSAL